MAVQQDSGGASARDGAEIARPSVSVSSTTAYWILFAILALMPALASEFVLVQIFGRAGILGLIALSLMFLAGYGGMVSLAQMSIAGLSGYMIAIFGTSAIETISLGWSWYVTVLIALFVATLFGTAVGALAVRTEGIYTIMITLAIASAFFYITNQNYEIINGISGINGIAPPEFLGVSWGEPIPLYYLILFFTVLGFLGVTYVSRAPFGLALQGIRDNPRRMAALGYNVFAHRVAAYAFASFIAAIAGVLNVWQNGQISPGTSGIGPVIDILVIAVVGGIGRPIGPFIGAIIYVLLQTFAIDWLVAVGLGGDRFRMLIGLVFLLIVFFSPDGALGLYERARAATRRDPLRDGRRDEERDAP